MAALSIITVKCVALSLSLPLAGTYNSAYGYLQLFGILADFGLYAVAIRELSSAQNKGAVLGAMLWIRLGTLTLSLGAALILVWLLPQWRGTPFPLAVTIAALVPFFTLLAGVIRAVFQVHYAMHLVFVAEVLQRIITTGLIAAFAVSGIRGSESVHFVYLFLAFGGVGSLFLLCTSLYLSKQYEKVQMRLNWSVITQLLRRSLPFGLAYLFLALYRQFDVTMIALLRPDFDVQNAYYGFVVRMTDMGFLIPTFLLNSLLPTLSDKQKSGEETSRILGNTLITLVLLGGIAALFAWLWAKPLTLLMTTPQYVSTGLTPGSDTALMWTALPLLLNGFILYAFYVLLAQHRWKSLVSALCIAGITSLTLNAILVPQYGFMGPVATSNVVHVFLLIVLVPFGLRAAPWKIDGEKVVRIVGVLVALGALLSLSAPYVMTEIRGLLGLAVAGVFLVGLISAAGLKGTLIGK